MKIENCSVVFRLFPSKSPKKILHQQYLAIAQNGWNLEYRPQRFHAIIMRFPIPNERGKSNIVAALIFKSGKVVLTGVPRPELGELAARKVSKNLRLAALRGRHPFEKGEGLIYGMRVVNIVAAHQIPHRIGIERIHKLWRWKKMEGMLNEDARLRLISKSAYDPTIFPALRCKFFDGNTSPLVYTTGKVIFTGVKQITQLEEIFNSFVPLLSQFPR